MRYQQPIFKGGSCDRNTDMYLVNMSSDMCVYKQPNYTVSGGCKIVSGITTADTCVHIIEKFTDIINLNFQLSGGTSATTFGYEIYKYDNSINGFDKSVNKVNDINYASSVSTNIQSSSLYPDGEYLIKLFFKDVVCTDILGRLGEIINTEDYNNKVYDLNTDYYFIVFKGATVPNLNQPRQNTPTAKQLHTQRLYVSFDGQTQLAYNNIYDTGVMITLNGLTLAKDYDFSIDHNLITFSGDLFTHDMVTIAGVLRASGPYSSNNGLTNDAFEIDYIPSGPTGDEGTSNVYFNTLTNHFEVFTTTDYVGISIITLNGVTLAPNIDYSASSTNNRGIVLNGDLYVNDVVTIVYQTNATVIGGVTTESPLIYWSLDESPINKVGWFDFEVSDVSDFSNIIQSTNILYISGQIRYSSILDLTGLSVGDTIYYRVKNTKVYQTIMGDDLVSIKTTPIIPIIIEV